MSDHILSGETEIRHLPLSLRRELAEILESREAWKILMSAITEETESGETKLKYNNTQISMVEREANINPSKLTAAEILFDEWGTSGKKRPTLQTLMDLLVELTLTWAASFISVNILKGEPFPSPPTIPLEFLENQFEAVVAINNEEEEDDDPPPEIIPYETLEDCCGWNNPGAGKEEAIGVGAFACVFKAKVPGLNSGEPIAVKRFHLGNDRAVKQFETELRGLCMVKHQNVLRILGVSEGVHSCLLLELMEGGNLEDNLACKKRPTPINWKDRIKIAMGTASALQHLHRLRFVHRDVKSANILLDSQLAPKLGDFGLLQQDDDDVEDKETDSQLEIAGTSCYMSPEAITYGRVSAKGDVFSFGVVLLELLTSLLPDDVNRVHRSLLLHVEEVYSDHKSIAPILDTKAGIWGGIGQPVAHKLYNLAVQCVDRREGLRVDMKSVYEKLSQLPLL